MISYDTNVLIYALGLEQEWSGKAQEIVASGERQGAVLSVLLWQEFFAGLINLKHINSKEVREVFDNFTITNFVPVTKEIVEKAIDLIAKSEKKIKNHDAVLLATAIVHGATEFWTNDKQILTIKTEEIQIRSLA